MAMIAMEKVQLENDKISLRVFGEKYLVKIRVNHSLQVAALDRIDLSDSGAQRSRHPFRRKLTPLLLGCVDGIAPAFNILT